VTVEPDEDRMWRVAIDALSASQNGDNDACDDCFDFRKRLRSGLIYVRHTIIPVMLMNFE
jgi:hypothetical protein